MTVSQILKYQIKQETTYQPDGWQCWACFSIMKAALELYWKIPAINQCLWRTMVAQLL
jgi:hypothetical protein